MHHRELSELLSAHIPCCIRFITQCFVLQVTVGNEEYPLGLLEYQTTSENSPLPQHITIVIAITGTILVLIIIIILIIYRRKSTEAERQFKKMQIQLDTLESNVRNECKQGMMIISELSFMFQLNLNYFMPKNIHVNPKYFLNSYT